MAERYVYFGHVTFDDADGVHRSAYRGDLVKFSKDDEKRLDDLGALYPKDWDPDAAADAAAVEAAAPTGIESELQRARQEVARRDAQIAELQQALATATGQPADTSAIPVGPPGSPGELSEDQKREARNAARRAAAAARKPDKPSTKASAAKAAKEDQAATGQPIASDPFDPTNQTPPVAVDENNQPLPDQPAAPPVE